MSLAHLHVYIDISKNVPFYEKRRDVILAIIAHERPNIPSYIQRKPDIASLIRTCWDSDPLIIRPSANEACEKINAVCLHLV